MNLQIIYCYFYLLSGSDSLEESSSDDRIYALVVFFDWSVLS